VPDDVTTDRGRPQDGRRLARVILRDQRDADGVRSLSATHVPGGGIFIEGHDLGAGVERIFGFREYEWTWDIEADAVPAAIAALDGREGDDPLRLLAAWSAAHGAIDPGSHLREVGVPIKFWNRIGD
jgi:hypothetical protein